MVRPRSAAGSTVLPDDVPAAARPRRRWWRTLLRITFVGVLALVVGASTFVGGLLAAPADFSLPPQPKPVLLFASDGTTQIGSIAPPERREPVAAKDIPQVMRDAIIAAEDERFLAHKGVDPLATLRAAYRDLTGAPTQGGSTLTQQYVKNAYVGNDRSALRKVREAALAVRLERRIGKQEILTDYLNALYLGNGLYGVQAASKYYFGVPVKDLDLDERTKRRSRTLAVARAAMLAGTAPAPSVWNPVADFATARERQQYTLNRMVVGKSITATEASAAFAQSVKPLREAPLDGASAAPEFTDMVKAQLRSQYHDEGELFSAGLRVRTTLDPDLQAAVTKAVHDVLPDRTDPQAAVVAVDIQTGAVRAMTTLRRVPKKVDSKGRVRPAADGYRRGGYNLATKALRSSGSTIKPFTLAVALEQGQSLYSTRTVGNCGSLPNPGGKPDPYRFCNSDKSEAGTFTLRRALADSVNTVYVPLARDVGRGKVAALAEKAGLEGRIAPGNLSFGIGAGVEVTPLSMATAYATLADHGVRHEPQVVAEVRAGGQGADEGQVVSKPAAKAVQAIPAGVADQVAEAMGDVVTSGTGTAARQPFPVFGKTGTTNDSTDAWFVGCAPAEGVCLATWMGYSDISCTGVKSGSCGGMKGVHGVRQVFGGTLPAKIFAESFAGLRDIRAKKGEKNPSFTPSPSPTPSPARLRTRPTSRPAAVLPRRTPTPRPTQTPRPTPSPTRTATPPPTKAPTVPTSPPAGARGSPSSSPPG